MCLKRRLNAMNKQNKTFGEKLIEIEKPKPSYKEKYEIEKKKMFEKKSASLEKSV